MKRLAATALFFCMLGGFTLPARAEALPSASELRAKIAAASGNRPPASEEVVRYAADGLACSRTTLRSAHGVREIDLEGTLHSESGIFEQQRWHQNDNGQTVLEQPDPGNAADDSYVTTVGRVHVPTEAYALSRLNRAGGGSRDYVDPVTFHVVRSERITPTETTVTTFDDFRAVAGYTRAWHWTVRDGHPENDAEYRVATFLARPVTAEEVRIPPSRRGLVAFPAGKPRVDLPARLVNEMFVVRVTIAGRGLDFGLDTGAGTIVIDENVARQLGFTPLRHESNAVNAGRYRQSTIVVPAMQVGELQMHDVVLRTIPEIPQQPGETKIVGLLGFDFIAELALRLDYEHAGISAMLAGDEPVQPPGAHSLTLDVRLGTQQPLTSITVNGAVGERFAVDTGASSALLINDYFARRYPHALVDRGGGGAARSMTFSGVGGRLDLRPYQLAAVDIGNVRFTDFVAYRVMERTSFAIDSDGLIGAQLLHYFTVWLDYANSHIVLVRNGAGSAAFH